MEIGFRVVGERKRAMRKRIRVVILAAIVAAVVVPVGFALSLDSGAIVRDMSPRTPVVVASSAAAPLAAPMIVTTRRNDVPLLSSVPDGAKLFIVGAMLFGLAAVVRKAA